MSKDDKRANRIPSFYLYKGADGKWYKTSEELTREINDHVFRRKSFDTQGRAFYPQWSEPEFKSETQPAWYLHTDGECRQRWTITTCTHKRSHHGCTPLGNGECLQQKPLRVGWDPKTKLWTKDTPLNLATSEQMRKFKKPTI